MLSKAPVEKSKKWPSQKAWNSAHKDLMRSYVRQWRRDNPAEYAALCRKHQAAYRARKKAIRLATDPDYAARVAAREGFK